MTRIIAVLLLSVAAFAQTTRTLPTLDRTNTWTGANTLGKRVIARCTGTGDATLIQGLIDAGNRVIQLSGTTCAFGSTTVTVVSNTTLDFGMANLSYSGTGDAIYGADVSSVAIKNIRDTDISSWNAAARVIHLQDCVDCFIDNVRVSSSEADASVRTAILFDTGSTAPKGALHNFVENSRFRGVTVAFVGASDWYMTTSGVLNTYGARYYVQYGFVMTFYNATAEGGGDCGFCLDYPSGVWHIVSDIEGDFTDGIKITNNTTFFLFGAASFTGWTGAGSSLNGTPNGGLFRDKNGIAFYGNYYTPLSLTKNTTYAASSGMYLELGASNTGAVDNTRPYKYQWVVEGDNGGQLFKLRQFDRGGTTVDPVIVNRDGTVSVIIPTSCTGHATGSLWNDSGTVKVCP